MRKKRIWAAAFLAACSMGLQALAPAASLAAPIPDTEEIAAPVMAVETLPIEEAAALPDVKEASQENSADAAAPESSAEQILEEGQVWVQDYDGLTGQIRVRIYGADPSSEVEVAAWPVGMEESAKSYTAETTDRKTRTASVSIADFGYKEGWYEFRACERRNGDVRDLGFATAPVAFSHGILRVTPADDTETAFRVVLEDARVPEGARVWFRVRGQTDMQGRYYPAMLRDEGYSYQIYTQHHARPGQYIVTACVGLPSPDSTVLDTTSFRIDGIRSSDLRISSVDGSKGSFDFLLDADAPSGLKAVRFAVWSEPDKSDLKWYDGSSEDGKTYSAATDISAHNGNFGTYTVQANVELGNGIAMLTPVAQADIVPRNYIGVQDWDDGYACVYVLGPDPVDPSVFRAAVWSKEEDQDDLVWYDGFSDDESGTVHLHVDPSNHNHPGTFVAHVYAGDTFVGSVEFDVPEEALLTEAERRIAQGCRRVYDEVGTDLHDNYMWVVNNFSYIRRSDHLEPPSGYTRQQWYAVEGLENQSGNCYTFASTFCELAKGLGYDATYVEGDVFGVGQKWWAHGFVLIRKDGGTYICDPELEFASSGRNLYMQPISSPKATYRW